MFLDQNIPNLPLGSSDFTTLRIAGEVYVDKTAMIGRLAATHGKIFLARPRRFGKSLLLSTFESLFRDGLKYFEGLDIAASWNDKTYPVVRLDFSEICEFSEASAFRKNSNKNSPLHLAMSAFTTKKAITTLSLNYQTG